MLVCNQRLPKLPAVDSTSLLHEHLQSLKIVDSLLANLHDILGAESRQIDGYESWQIAQLHRREMHLSLFVFERKERFLARVDKFQMFDSRVYGFD